MIKFCFAESWNKHQKQTSFFYLSHNLFKSQMKEHYEYFKICLKGQK